MAGMYPIRLQAAEYFEVPEVVCEDAADQDENRHGWCCETVRKSQHHHQLGLATEEVFWRLPGAMRKPKQKAFLLPGEKLSLLTP